MVFRPRNVSSKANRMYEEAKISGYGGFFNSDVYEAKVYDSKVEDVEVPPESYEADGKYGDVNIRRRNHAANSMAGSGKYSD